MSRSPVLLSGLAYFVTAHFMSAAVITVTNPGFENITGQTTYNEFTFGIPTGWTIYDPSGIVPDPDVYTGTLQPNGVDFFPVTAPEGSRVAILFNSDRKGDGEYGYSQILADTLQPNTQYTLTVQVGNITSGTSLDNTVYDLSNFPGYRIDFLAGGNVLSSDLNSLTITEGAWSMSTITFTTGASVLPSQNLGIRLVSLNATVTSPDNEVDFDDVHLDAIPIPEPGTVAHILAGAVVFLMVRVAKKSFPDGMEPLVDEIGRAS